MASEAQVSGQVHGADQKPPCLARMENVSKRFPAVLAVDAVTFELRLGEVHALLGENGAGKTTLMNILYGLYHADSGGIFVEGQPVRLRSPADAQAHGLGMVHQSFRQIPTLTVTENVLLGLDVRRPLLELRQAEDQIRELSRRYGLDIDPRSPAWQLSAGQRQRVEILKVLYRKAHILILDEPTSVLTPIETEGLFGFIEQFKREGGAVVFISHKLGEVKQISDRVSVMRDGRLLCTVTRPDIDLDDLACLMVGREVVFRLTKTASAPGEVLLHTDQLSALTDAGLPALQEVTLDVHRGEILGVAGVAGNGQGELAEVVCGLRRAMGGEVLYKGNSIRNLPTREILRRGIALAPDNPRQTGVFPKFSVQENVSLRLLDRPGFQVAGLIDEKACGDWTDRVLATYDVRPRDPMKQAGELSGGNLQKLVLGCQLELDPEMIIAADPTAGLDVGATEFLRKQLLAERGRGKGILLISSDLDEIMSLSDRIAVMYRGRIAGIVTPANATPRIMGRLMAGLPPTAPADAKILAVGETATDRDGAQPVADDTVGKALAAPAQTRGTSLRRSFGSKLHHCLVDPRSWITLFSPVVAIGLAALVVSGLAALFGVTPARLFRAMWMGGLGTPNGIAETLILATPLLLGGLGVVIAFRAGVWNIGIDGQIYAGGLGATLVALAGASLPAPLLLPLVALGGFLGGALYAAIPGALRAYRGVNEIITTIMFNYVAVLFVSFLVSGPLKSKTLTLFPESAPLVDAARLPKLIPGTRAHVGIFVALAAAVVVWVFLWKAAAGWRLRAIGENPIAARFVGINVPRQILLAMCLSGGLAGLAGMVEISGVRGALTSDFSANYGFTAIAVALFGGLQPAGVVVAALFFAFLSAGAEGLQRSVGINSATVYIVQGLVIVFVLGRRAFLRES